MSGTDDDRDLLAGEYVLGTLDSAERDAARAETLRDPAFAAAVQAWEQRLAPLGTAVRPIAPPPDLFARIERSLGQPAAVEPGVTRLRRQLALWRGATGAAALLAAGLAAFAFLRPPPVTDQAPLTAVLAAAGAPSSAVFLAQLQPDGRLLIRPLGPLDVAAGRDLELWSLPAGATVPVSLGVLPADGTRIQKPVGGPQGQLLVSLEPKGGSPTGAPTGPVVYAGTLTRFE